MGAVSLNFGLDFAATAEKPAKAKRMVLLTVENLELF